MNSQSSTYSSHDPTPEERRLNHMICPQSIPFPHVNTFHMTETDQLQYDIPRGDYLQTNSLPMNLTRPDVDMLMQDIDISSFSLADLDAFCSPQKGLNDIDDNGQFYLQPSDYQNTTVPLQLRSSPSTATSSTYLFNQTLESSINQGLHSRVLNQGPHSTDTIQQGPAMGASMWAPIDSSQPSMNDGVMASSMVGSKESSMLDKKKNLNARGFRRRRYHPRHASNRKAPQSLPSERIKSGTPVSSQTPSMQRENMTSRSMTYCEEKKDDHVDPEQALNLLKRSIETQPYSSISQREMAALIKKIEDVVLREKLYGSSSSDSGEVTIPSTVSDSISNPENIEPEDSTDATSVFSTPRLTVDETPDAEAAEAQTVHKMNCPHCGNKPNYYCSKRGCGYFAHTRGDAKRHEEGEKHYPQARFMCCECPLAHVELDANGNPICEFCNTFCLNSGLLRTHYLHCADAKNMGKTFSRKDHFIQHLREEHTIFNDAQYVATSRYPIASNWPRQCSRCPKTFQTWEERMKHLAEHAEEDFHPQGFAKKPKDDDDDDDNDDHNGGGGGSQGKRVGRQIKATLAMQHSHTPTSFNNAPSSHDNYRSRTGAPSGMSDQAFPNMKPSLALERYLNDEDNPVLLPLAHQKCESKDTQLVTGTLQYNNPEMTSQESADSDRNDRSLSAKKRNQSHDISLLPSPQTLPFSKTGPYPVYPIRMPPEKQEKALQLYVKYIRAEKFAQMDVNSHYLTPPNPQSVVRSTSSSRQKPTFIPSSTSDRLTDLSSVISFDDRENSSFRKSPLGELISFDGKTIKRRERRRLSPTTKAKAALVRHLGSCWVCTSRKVPCPIEHHDIAALDGLYSQWEYSRTLGNPPNTPNLRAGNNFVLCDAGGGTVDVIAYLVASGSNSAPVHQIAPASHSQRRRILIKDAPFTTPTPTRTQRLTLTPLSSLAVPRIALSFDTRSDRNCVSPAIIKKLGLSALQMRFELTENSTLSKFEIRERPGLESALVQFTSPLSNSGKSQLILNGPWSSKEPTSKLSAQELRGTHCFTKGLHDLLKPDRKPSQSMRGDDSVSAVTMEIPHVHLKITDSRIDPEDAEPDLPQTDPKRKSEAHIRMEPYTADHEWRENVKEQIRALSRPVPMQRPEDEKPGKPLPNKSSSRPILAGLSTSPWETTTPQATSGLPRSEYQRETAGNITTGIPIQENDQGLNERDVLDRAASWTRDLMGMLYLKLQQQEELANIIVDLGGTFPFKETKEERRIGTELMKVMAKDDGSRFHSEVIHKTPRAVYETTTPIKERENRLPEERDSGYEASILESSVYRITMAENELAKSTANSPTNSERSLPSGQQSMKVKKASTLLTCLFKLTRKDTEIIDAASDGDIAKVAKLIGRGANVNTRDKWGWTALSMCASGGFHDIARLLLDHGADLDNIDVDGDTPEIVALHRGRMNMVKLFHEERLSRVSGRATTPPSSSRDMETQLPSVK